MRDKYEKPLLTEDYLIRMINLALAAIARVVGLKTVGQYEAAHEAVDQILGQIFGLSSQMIRMLDDGVLLAHLTHQGVLDTDRLSVVAELMREEGDLFAARGLPAEAYWSNLRALNFYLEVALNGGSPSFPNHAEKIDGLQQVMRGLSLPPTTLYSLFRYHDENQAFGEGVRALSKLLETADYTEDLKEEGLAFYRQVLSMSDEILEAHRLDRSLVESKMADLNRGRA